MDDSQFESYLAKLGLAKLVNGEGSWVLIVVRQSKNWNKVSVQDRAALKKRMELWCRGDDFLTPEMLKFEQRVKGVRVSVFKPPKGGQGRAYGAQIALAGRRIFVVGSVDVKKQDKADYEMFERVADFVSALQLD